MENSKLIQILKTFTPEEFRGYEKLVSSSFFNEGRNYLPIVKELRKFHPQFNNRKLTKEYIYSVQYPLKKYNDSLMRAIISRLMKMAEEYLSQINFQNEKFAKKFFLLEELSKRRLTKLFDNNLKIAETSVAELQDFHENYYRNKRRLEDLKQVHHMLLGKVKLMAEDSLKESEYHIYEFVLRFLIEFFDLIECYRRWGNGYEDSVFYEFYKRFNIEDFIKSLREKHDENYPIIAVYYYRLMSYMNMEEESYYRKFRKLVNEHSQLFKKAELRELYTGLQLVCIGNARRGKAEYERELFNLYKEILSKDIYRPGKDEFIHINLFRSIIINSLILKEFKWTEKFINDYINQIHPDFREAMFNFSTASLEFAKGNFEKSLENIIKVSLEFFYFKWDTRSLMLKIYYELNLFEQALSLIDAYKHFISNDKEFSELNKTKQKGFVDFTYRLIRIKLSSHPSYKTSFRSDKRGLKEELLRTENIAEKGWLLEKIDDLDD